MLWLWLWFWFGTTVIFATLLSSAKLWCLAGGIVLAGNLNLPFDVYVEKFASTNNETHNLSMYRGLMIIAVAVFSFVAWWVYSNYLK